MMSPVRKVEHTAEANAEWSRFAVRNSSRYRIGEVASLLGITPQAVRYYEEEGIINPERNPLSGYRYYSAWDINMLMRIRTYRQQGFSMEEIRDVMREFNPGLTVSYLGEKAQALHDTICEQIVYMNRLRDEQSVVEEARVGYRRFVVTYRPPMHFLQTQPGITCFLSILICTAHGLQSMQRLFYRVVFSRGLGPMTWRTACLSTMQICVT